MKIYLLLLSIITFGNGSIYANETTNKELNCICSQTRKNIYVLFCDGAVETNYDADRIVFPVDKKIEYGFRSTQSTNYDVFALAEEYGCIITARSESGQDVAKTSKGRDYGVRFGDVTSLDKSQLDYTRGRGNGGYQCPYISVAPPSDEIVLSRDLPPLDQLFKFDKPGKFVVSIRLQCFVGPYDQSTPANVTLVRFPPVELTVIKKEEQE